MSNEIKEARERMPIDSPFDPFILLRCFGEEVLELRAHIDLISQKLVASESLYKAYKEDSKKMYHNSSKNDSNQSIEDVRSLVDASGVMLKWCVKNVHQWNFSEYDWLHSATEKVKQSLPKDPNGETA